MLKCSAYMILLIAAVILWVFGEDTIGELRDARETIQ